MSDQEIKMSTEEQILKSAIAVFQRDGFSGARMQDIADLAGINKALLHYYYRSKDKLFQAVFVSVMSKVIDEMQTVLASDVHLVEKIRLFFDKHISFMQKNQFVPGFLISELNRNPELVLNVLKEINVHKTFGGFVSQINQAIEKGDIRPIDPQQLFINMLALSVFPFGARGMLFGVLQFDENRFDEFVEARKSLCAEIIINWIKKA